MTYRIPKSVVRDAGALEVEIANFAHEMRQWRAHMRRVAEDEKNGVEGIEKHHPLVKPSGHPTVEAAVNEHDQADYEIFDDGPSPEELFAAKKADFNNRVMQAEADSIAAIIPPSKHRFFILRESAINEEDGQRASECLERMQSSLRKVGEAIGVMKPIDLQKEIEKLRSPEDNAFLAEQRSRRERISKIQMKAAKAQHDIDDLTIETVDSFKLPDFSI
jgi:hypothetical protein